MRLRRSAPTEWAAIGAGERPASEVGALAPRAGVGVVEQPEHGRARAADERVRAGVLDGGEHVGDLRAQPDRRLLQVVVQQLARGRQRRAERERDAQLLRELLEFVPVARPAEAVGLA